jgi:hypothetical protein
MSSQVTRVKNSARLHQFNRGARKNGSRIRERRTFVVTLHIDPLVSQTGIVVCVSVAHPKSRYTTTLWRVARQRWRGK